MAVLLRDSVYHAIRQAILACEFQPGQELREQILAEKYHVSRSPVRDSLLRLERENLVTVLPRQGYRVNLISDRDIHEMYCLRLIIAPACAAEAARADDEAVRTLDQFRAFSADELQEAEFLKYNRAFHFAVADLAGNRRLAVVEKSLAEEFDRVITLSLQAYDSAWVQSAIVEHGEIINAIQAHDSDTAYRLSRSHVARGQERMRKAKKQEAGDGTEG